MAAQTGQRSTFNDTVGLRLDLENILPILVDPYDVPLYTRFASKAPANAAVKHEWLEEPLLANKSTTSANVLAGDGTIVVADGSQFKAGYVIQIDSEQMRVTSVATNTLTVSRGYAGTTAAGHDGSVTAKDVLIVGYAVTDGADPATFSTTDRTNKYNYHQVFQELIEVTTLDEWATLYGIGDKFAHEVEKWLKTLAIRAEMSILFGQRAEDATNKTRTMGGLEYFITTNVKDEASAQIDEDVINGHCQESYTNGGRVDLIALPPTQKKKASALISASQRWFPRPGMNEAIGVAADEYISDFGRVELLMDRNILSDRAYYLQTDLVSKVTGMPFTLENLAKTGSSRKSQIIGWFSLEVKAEKRHAISKNLATV